MGSVVQCSVGVFSILFKSVICVNQVWTVCNENLSVKKRELCLRGGYSHCHSIKIKGMERDGNSTKLPKVTSFIAFCVIDSTSNNIALREAGHEHHET